MARVTNLEFSRAPESASYEPLEIEGHKRITWPSTFRVKMTWSDGSTSGSDIRFSLLLGAMLIVMTHSWGQC